jgi:uncharacterized membrane protein
MHKLIRVLTSLVVGYLAGAVAGYLLVTAASSNTHDRSGEAAMTAVFVAGPVASLIAGIVALVRESR